MKGEHLTELEKPTLEYTRLHKIHLVCSYILVQWQLLEGFA